MLCTFTSLSTINNLPDRLVVLNYNECNDGHTKTQRENIEAALEVAQRYGLGICWVLDLLADVVVLNMLKCVIM